MTLIFDRLLEVVNVHVHAKFHQAKFSCSWVVVLMGKKRSDDAENNNAVASAGSNNKQRGRITAEHPATQTSALTHSAPRISSSSNFCILLRNTTLGRDIQCTKTDWETFTVSILCTITYQYYYFSSPSHSGIVATANFSLSENFLPEIYILGLEVPHFRRIFGQNWNFWAPITSSVGNLQLPSSAF